MKHQICPYPGLRPFTQEESIFFKGRDLHVRQVINQLEERKFVLITGASGDGKSSLVYAGVIPNALAGFFHAEYNNWLFVDFRPERDPIGNLTKALTDKMKLPLEEVSERLQFGFASLVNVYKSSSFYINKNGDNWKQASDAEKKKMRNKAANILILADQFEEFFTNQENFNNGKPSINAYTTVNILLETARLAIKEKLPIYIVFTMRSDFISQCVAFKNLPEFIGFSQFFVPRLKRNELQQVIEEPALLAGGKISKRLVEVLINELRDGFDQLPVLQHCLNTLWHLADNGDSELDLIHLVKAAGMQPKYLNQEDSKLFSEWFSSQDEMVKKFYDKPSLANVLNTHANLLYFSAFDYFSQHTDWAEKNITREDAFFIIKTTFQCLTKIDEGRSVRNRMTLADIARIINKKHITPEVICGVMNIFRLPSNTFIRPFIDKEDIATQYISVSTVLDITHEALIRNWEFLRGWEEEESQNLMNFRDFEIQLHRWADNEKSSQFLLSSGNLAHFEEWYAKSNLNPYWIFKYDNDEIPAGEKIEKARILAALSKEFLHVSRQNILSIEKARKIRRRIAAGAAVTVISVLSGFTYWALQEKANAQSQEHIAIDQTKLAGIARQKAEGARKDAERNAVLANNARLQSEKAREVAEKMRSLADEKTQLALSESEKARTEKQRADKQLIVAQEQRSIADVQRKKAESATESARSLSYLAVAQSLTFKADKNYGDAQVNLLLAYQAYLLNRQNGGNPIDPDVFQAMLAARNYYGASPVVYESDKPLSTFRLSSENSMECFSKSGSYSNFDIKAKRTISGKIVSSLMPVNESFIIPGYVLVSYANYQVLLWNMQNDQKQVLPGYTDQVRSVIYLKKKKQFVTGSRDKLIRLYSMGDFKLIKSKVMGARISGMVSSSDENTLYVACANGEVVSCNVNSFECKSLTSGLGTITALTISADGSKLVAATAKGKIRSVNLIDNSFSDFEVSQSMIDAMAIDATSEMLAVSSADKVIRVYRLSNLNMRPYLINKHNQKSSMLMFSPSRKLYALGIDNKVRCWETGIDLLASDLKAKITRNFTKEEWEKYVGKGVEYQK